jgi:hypothetical protein
MNSFKHSGAVGDLVYSLPIVKHFGGGRFYLHLNQIDWIGQHYYGNPPDPFHQGRMNERDFEYMREFMLAQDYITEFGQMSSDIEITHNLDRFRPVFVGHPTNYIDIYSAIFNILDANTQKTIRTTPWLTVPSTRRYQDRDVVINRTQRWIPAQPSPQWQVWKDQGIEDRAVFVGLPDEYADFQKSMGWNIPYQPTQTMLELAQYIAGADLYIGNQSQGLALAIGLGLEQICCEARVDMPLERNECYFPDIPRIVYF